MKVELATTILRDNLSPEHSCHPEIKQTSFGIQSNAAHQGNVDHDAKAFILPSDDNLLGQTVASNEPDSLSSSESHGSGMPKPLQELEKSAISAFKPFENVKILNEQK